MATSIISAGDAANLGVQTTGGDDGVLVLRSGAAGAKVDALSIAAVGTGAFVGEVTATGFTGTLDGVLGGGTPAAATVTTLNASDQVVVSGSGNRSMSITSTDGIASMEIGAAASNAAFIDFKTPSGDDFDVRMGSLAGGAGGSISTVRWNYCTGSFSFLHY